MIDMQRVADAIRAFEKGEMVVVTDDDDRENEGDLIVSANKVTPEQMAFIIRHSSGIVCTPMTAEDAERLQLTPMVAHNNAPLSTAFTVSVDFKHGTTTGISAEERCTTVHGLANGNAAPADFVRPGHVFPLIAKEGGVLVRSGHTEAAVDLCRLAGLPPVGVISELVNDNGSVKRGPEVLAFAQEHGIKHVSVADLIAYRQRTEHLVDRIDEFDYATRHGLARAVTFRAQFDDMEHLALVFGDIRGGTDIPVRLHQENVLGDVFGANGNLDEIVKRFAADKGVLVYLRDGSPCVANGSMRPREGLEAAETEEHRSAKTRDDDWRDIGLGAQILTELGISSIQLLSSKERHYVGLNGFGLQISGTVLI
ncbi:3,4-dihydroxy 2-butanone 4-phosphate synthase / GTP cyclohydrolase II [Cohaesibacter sp. ES.047]|uniref:3,4-dihydroxy-2-butanone-4-phosphate synthase n=1 Tax=Cohaesibacter sp. ES.047 TaxID=1798205 RepID=UPI000BB697EB|nr:3,4-dihydroxy-2-butanone-4-phosphate synthase [Cohaesibacter sp. ES.047]SNY92496.1 3,4-dihydroxy 2-butanone 4-phosphate synthase / GTP cyclohydrolase II [Cohaesibacter sp. ES.047]